MKKEKGPLLREQDIDYILPDGRNCWITLGEFSVFVKHNGLFTGKGVEIFRLGEELEDPIFVADLN